MRRVQTQLMVAFVLVIFFVLCGVSVALLLILGRGPQQERVALIELRMQARTIAQLARWGLNPELHDTGSRASLSDIAKAQDLRIGWATAQGSIVFDSENRWGSADALPLFPQLRPIRDGQRVGQIRENGEVWWVLAYPVPEVGTPRRYLILARRAQAAAFLEVFRETIAPPLIQAGLLALALGLTLAMIISRSISKPLRDLSVAAHAIAEGDWGAHVDLSGPSELRELARTFNDMAARLEAYQRSQQDLVINLAHDLRTPLTSIQGFAQALLDGTADDSQIRREAAQAIYEESQRLHRMAQNLLDLARFESGQTEIRREPINLVELARTRVLRLAPLAAEKEIKTQVQSRKPSMIVLGDETRLAQVFDNLLSNAIEHTDLGGSITLSLHDKASMIQLCVADTGSGIPGEELPRVFERFYRGDRSRHGSGTGLGLAIAREIIQAHGGTIQVESVVDIGTRFLIELPTPESV